MLPPNSNCARQGNCLYYYLNDFEACLNATLNCFTMTALGNLVVGTIKITTWCQLAATLYSVTV